MAVAVALGLYLVLIHARLGEDFLVELLLLGHEGFALLHVFEHGAVHHPLNNRVGFVDNQCVRAEEYHGVAQVHSVLPPDGSSHQQTQQQRDKVFGFHHGWYYRCVMPSALTQARPVQGSAVCRWPCLSL